MKILRPLNLNDKYGMYEWMHDDNVINWFSFDGKNMTLENVENFINSQNSNEKTIHFAICNDDEYAGTLSLKNIDDKCRHAEMAISLRTKFHGTGLSKKAVEELFDIAINEYKLHKLYLNVMSKNERAIKFYKKMGFEKTGYSKDHLYKNGIFYDLLWFERML